MSSNFLKNVSAFDEWMKGGLIWSDEGVYVNANGYSEHRADFDQLGASIDIDQDDGSEGEPNSRIVVQELFSNQQGAAAFKIHEQTSPVVLNEEPIRRGGIDLIDLQDWKVYSSFSQTSRIGKGIESNGVSTRQPRQKLSLNPDSDSQAMTIPSAPTYAVKADRPSMLLRDRSEISQTLTANSNCCCCFCYSADAEAKYNNSVPGVHPVASNLTERSGPKDPKLLAVDSGIRFVEFSVSESGIDHVGLSYGAAWGDVNGDSYTDLWLNNHFGGAKNSFGTPPILYLNLGDGTFRDATAETFGRNKFKDKHGTAWADFDNDGDQDLIQTVGALTGDGIGPAYANQFFINEGGNLEDQATIRGVDYSLARGRGVLWFDFNRDGLLDLVEGAEPRTDKLSAPPKIFQQRADGTFIDAAAITGFKLPQAQFFIYSDVSGDGNLDLLVHNDEGLSVYDITSRPFSDITLETIPNTEACNDIVSADFNGDLKPDLYLTRGSFGGDVGPGNVPVSDLYQNGPNNASVRISNQPRTEKGLYFESDGEVTFAVGSAWNLRLDLRDPDNFYIGAQGFHPTRANFILSPDDHPTRATFTLSPDDPRSLSDLRILLFNRRSQVTKIGYCSQSNGSKVPLISLNS
jgi:hypothetical protein